MVKSDSTFIPSKLNPSTNLAGPNGQIGDISAACDSLCCDKIVLSIPC